jgi:hypothetical protein
VTPPVRIFGIRHHGPGSARALGASLEAWQPDIVLIEGPPEAAAVLALAGSADMRPPVALLAYVPKQPQRAIFYPMAGWSPEWVALRHALAHEVPVRMVDLPAAAALGAADPQVLRNDGIPSFRSRRPDEDPGGEAGDRPGARGDPLGRLAEAAGYDDPERWWEDVVEQRSGDEGPWEAITEAMASLREDEAPPAGREAQREAAMRQQIRAATKEGFQRVAVVCGAWHAPALATLGPAKADADLLTGLPRAKVAVTWVPWTSSRLAFASGYGAGVVSPGWYEHLFVTAERPVERWLAKAAALLRAEDLDAAPSSVIDAVRLAEALATLRGRPLAGLSECTDAVRAVLAGGSDLPLTLIHRRLVVGEDLGEVPPETPAVPLAADLAALQRRLRLKPEASTRHLDLDLRKDGDLARSHLLHRLDLLDVPWGVLAAQGQVLGTFHEGWSVGWSPELAVRVIEASVWGTTVEAAATTRASELATAPDASVATLTRLVERCLLAELSGAVAALMAALADQAAQSADAGELLAAVPPLARVLRYGSVRRSDASAVAEVVRGLVARACVGLGPACASLDDAAAQRMTRRIDAMTGALGGLDDAALRAVWLESLRRLADQPGLHGLVAGRSCRILLDAGALPADAVARRLSVALSPGELPARAAAWVEGLVAGSGLLLLHDPLLLQVIDEWLQAVADDTFRSVLPLLRRSFSQFEEAERRMLGEKLRGRDGPAAKPEATFEIDAERAATVGPLVNLLLTGRSE